VGHDASRYEVETLRRALPEMALALMNIRLERFLSDQVEANSELVVEERKRIAQDLHDTLAPNISYLRLKLDQLSCEGTLHDILEIQQDIERMHDAATEAYKQIRGTLTVLGPDAPGDLPEAIRECALRVGERAGFAVAMEHRPDRLPLDPAVRRELLFICREALNNVEKHAGAQQVTIRIHGDKRELQVSIADDGKGFDRDQAPPDGHFGLAVMRRRADAIGATLTVASAAGRGTHVELRIPVAGFDAGDLPDASRKGGRADSSV
jgi:two-component system nitrate/nitrite sensor histidine kinase NarX